jgi:hypothetical protein
MIVPLKVLHWGGDESIYGYLWSGYSIVFCKSCRFSVKTVKITLDVNPFFVINQLKSYFENIFYRNPVLSCMHVF